MAHILLVDDNLELLGLQADYLAHFGHTVVQAHNGREAMKLVEAGNFDLMITDIVMPEQDGLETIIMVRRKYPQLKILAVSGGGRVDSEKYLTMAQCLGAAKTLAKPFSAGQLLAAVEALLQPGE